MNVTTHDVKQQLQQGLSELSTVRDEIRVKMHLARMDAKVRWNEELEPRFFEMERQIKEWGEKTADQAGALLGKALGEITESYHRFRDSLEHPK